MVDGAIATVALPTLATALDISESKSVLLVTIYQFLLAIGLIPMSALGDGFGLRRIFRAGLLLFLASTLLCLVVDSFGQLLALRAAQAAGAALVLSVGSAQIRSIYPIRMLGRGLALNSLTVSVFTTLSPVMGVAILAVVRWQVVFASAAPLALIALAASFALPPSHGSARRFDWRSAVLYALAMTLLFAAFDGSLWNIEPMGRIALLVAAGALGWLVVYRARRTERPLFPVDLLALPIVALSACGALFAFASSMAVLVMLPFRLGQLHGMTIAEIGASLAIWPLTTMIAAPVVGMLSDKLPAWALGAGGLAGAAVALVLLGSAPLDSGVFDIGWRLALCGASYAAYTASNMRLVLASTPRDRAAPVGGMISTTRILGQSIGAIIAAAILANGWVALPQGLFAPMAFALIGMIISFTRRRSV